MTSRDSKSAQSQLSNSAQKAISHKSQYFLQFILKTDELRYVLSNKKNSRAYDGQPFQNSKCTDKNEIVLDIALLYDKDITFCAFQVPNICKFLFFIKYNIQPIYSNYIEQCVHVKTCVFAIKCYFLPFQRKHPIDLDSKIIF